MDPYQGWRIDYFIVNKQIIKAVIDSEIHDTVYGSDHVPISIDIKLPKITFKPPPPGALPKIDIPTVKLDCTKVSKEEVKMKQKTEEKKLNIQEGDSLSLDLSSIVKSAVKELESENKLDFSDLNVSEIVDEPNKETKNAPKEDAEGENTEDLLDLIEDFSGTNEVYTNFKPHNQNAASSDKASTVNPKVTVEADSKVTASSSSK